MEILMAWFGYANIMAQRNALMDKRAAEVSKLFEDGGFNTCVLKGQGVARLYPKPERRTSGDIDIWVAKSGSKSADRKAVLDFLKQKNYKIGGVVYLHADAEMIADAEVEVHFVPSFTFSPLRTKKFNEYFFRNFEAQCRHVDEHVGFAYPTNEFNAVFSLMHIFRHLFHEGIGLRLLMDYYYILESLTDDERKRVMQTLKWMGLERFTKAVMYVEQSIFELDRSKLLCESDEKTGSKMLEEIMLAGNFGHYDERMKDLQDKGIMAVRWARFKRQFAFFWLCPSEVLWSPLWKPIHFIWRQQFKKYIN